MIEKKSNFVKIMDASKTGREKIWVRPTIFNGT